MREWHATIIRDGILTARRVLAHEMSPFPKFARPADNRLWFRAYWRTLQRTTANRRAARLLRGRGWPG